jgi:hypothetical protein
MSTVVVQCKTCGTDAITRVRYISGTHVSEGRLRLEDGEFPEFDSTGKDDIEIKVVSDTTYSCANGHTITLGAEDEAES